VTCCHESPCGLEAQALVCPGYESDRHELIIIMRRSVVRFRVNSLSRLNRGVFATAQASASLAPAPVEVLPTAFGTARRRLTLAPAAIVLIVYAGSRVFSSTLLLGLYLLAPVLHLPYASHGSARPSFLSFLSSWDGKYYRQIALTGYPSQLPLNAAGHVESNAWAFLPVYPWLTRGVMLTTHLGFDAAGVIVAVLCGGAAALLLFSLFVDRLGTKRALWATAFFSFGPMTFLFETTYAESLFLVLIFAGIAMMIKRHYLLMIPFGVFISQLVRRDVISHSERIRMIVAGASLAVAGLAWPVIADTVTGDKSAYFDTELSWWTGWVGRVHFIPFTPWFDLFDHYLGAAGIAVVLALVGGFIWWLTRPSMRGIGDEMLAFVGSYGAYLIAVFLPQQSITRLLLPLSPLLGTPILTQTPKARRIVTIALVIAQPIAVAALWLTISTSRKYSRAVNVLRNITLGGIVQTGKTLR
jgi:hypothetical protein